MRTHHYIEDARLARSVGAALARRFPDQAHDEQAKDVVRDVRAWLQKQPLLPDLVGATEAARILGVQTPHVTRLRDQGRMPEGIPVGGSVEAYLRSEVEALGRKLEAERAERRRRRLERSGGARA